MFLFVNCIKSQSIIKWNPNVLTKRGRKLWPQIPDYSHIEMPPLESRNLPPMDPLPNFHGRRPIKTHKSTSDIEGPELVNNYLIHRQFGIMAITGGHITPAHITCIRNEVTKKLELSRMFAVWRIETPWKPIIRRGQGKRLGGGKGNIHHYATPVRAGSVIFEVGGHCEFEDVKHWLNKLANRLPCDAIAVSQELLDQWKKEEDERNENNINPFTMEYVIKHNMNGCKSWLSEYEMRWKGKYGIFD